MILAISLSDASTKRGTTIRADRSAEVPQRPNSVNSQMTWGGGYPARLKLDQDAFAWFSASPDSSFQLERHNRVS